MSFVVSKRESRTGLKRAFPKPKKTNSVAVARRPGPSSEQLEFAKKVEAELGYSALGQRAKQRQREDSAPPTQAKSRREVVLEALRSIGAPAPLTEESVKRYKRRKAGKNYAQNIARNLADICLVVGLFGPVFAVREYLSLDGEIRESTPATKAAAVAVGIFVGSILWVLGAFFFCGGCRFLGAGSWILTLPWVQLLVASLASSVPVRAARRWRMEDVKKSFLDRQWREWSTRSLVEYSSNVPERVLENAISIKRALKERGLHASFDVEEFSLIDRERLQRAWLVDPFLILEVGGERLYIDWWDETEFSPEYMY